MDGEGRNLLAALPDMAEGAETQDRPGADHDGEEDDRGTAEEQQPEQEHHGFFAADLTGVTEERWGSGSHPGRRHECAGKDVILKPICNLR